MNLPLSESHSTELATVLSIIGRSGSIVEVVAAGGMGKTTLLRAAADLYRQQFGGVVEFITGGRGFNPQDAIEPIAESFRAAKRQSLLVIDDAETMEAKDIFETVNRLGTGPWRFSTLLATRNSINIGHQISLRPFTREAIARLLNDRMGIDATPDAIDRLFQASQGVPLFADVLINQLREGATLKDIEDLVAPWRATGLIGPNGRSLSGRDPIGRRLITDVRLISNELIDHLSQFPNEVHNLTSRKFEELTAELLERQGYQVELTSETRDGGKDLYAVKKDGLGSFLFLIECKRYAADRSVGVGVVRSLHGVAQHERANGAVVLTTSFFSEPARRFAHDLRGQMSLKDFVDLQVWLRHARQNKRP